MFSHHPSAEVPRSAAFEERVFEHFSIVRHDLHILKEFLSMTVQDISTKVDTLTQAVTDLAARVAASLPDPTVVDAIGQKLDAATVAVGAIDPAAAPAA